MSDNLNGVSVSNMSGSRRDAGHPPLSPGREQRASGGLRRPLGFKGKDALSRFDPATTPTAPLPLEPENA